MKRWIYVFIALLVGVGMGAMFSPFSSVLVINSTKGAKAQFLSNEFNAPFGEQGKKLLAEIESTQLKNQDVLRLILAWIYVSLDVQRPSNLEREEGTLKNLAAVCGERDKLFRHLAKDLGFSSRRVNFWGVPGQVGHSATEVLIGGRWVFLDAMFGVYFTPLDAPDLLLGIEDARALYPDINIFKVAVPSWKGVWSNIEDLKSLLKTNQLFSNYSKGLFLHEHKQIPIASVPDTFFRSQLTLEDPIHSKSEMRWPMYFNLDTMPSAQLGQVDSDLNDLNPVTFHFKNDTEGYLPNLYVIGRNFNGVQIHLDWHLLSSKQKQVGFNLRFIKEVSTDDQRHLRIELDQGNAKFYAQSLINENQVVQNWVNPKELNLKFKVHPPAARLQLYFDNSILSQRSLKLDALDWHSTP